MKVDTTTVFVVAFIAVCTVSSAAAETNLVGTLAPAPVLADLNGNYHYLSRLYYEGNEKPQRPRFVVVLNFMSLKCPPCRKELPLFLEVIRPAIEQSKQAVSPIRFYLVSTDPLSAKEGLRTFLIEQKIDPQTEVLLDPYRKAAEKFGVSRIPRTFVISPEGRITADITGAVDDYKKRLQDGIEAAMKAKDAE